MRRLVFCWLLAALLSTTSFAQTRPTGGGGGRTTGRVNLPNPTPGLSSGSLFISGTVTLEDGTPLTESASIQTICRGQKRTETHTDMHGSFGFQFGGATPSFDGGIMDVESSSMGTGSRRSSQRDWRDCQLQASLTGYYSEAIELRAKVSSTGGSNDIGRITLHRMAHVDGVTVSATSLAAPDSARRAFEKGRSQAEKKKWDDAQKSLENAVQIYPKYAVAWSELGMVQMQRSDDTAAKASFSKAIEADSQYFSPFTGLARIAARTQQWHELIEVTDRLLALNPVSFPEAWYFNAAANYSLKKMDVAEKSTLRGMQLDEEKRIPRLEYLLAMILLQKKDYPGATEHMTKFLAVAGDAPAAAEARKQLAEIERLSTQARLTQASEKR